MMPHCGQHYLQPTGTLQASYQGFTLNNRLCVSVYLIITDGVT